MTVLTNSDSPNEDRERTDPIDQRRPGERGVKLVAAGFRNESRAELLFNT